MVKPPVTSAAASRRRRARAPIHVHAAEVSTDQETFGTYAETIALLTAIVAIAAAAWMVAMPSASAELVIPAEQPAAVAEFELVPGGAAVQPDLAGPAWTAVVVEPLVELPPLTP